MANENLLSSTPNNKHKINKTQAAVMPKNMDSRATINMSLFRNKAVKNKKNTKPQRNPDYIVHANLSNMKFTIHR